jgi:hypothetical protein
MGQSRLPERDKSYDQVGCLDVSSILDLDLSFLDLLLYSAPYLVILSDRGQTLRFFRASQIRLTDELLHDFLKEKRYLIQQPWSSIYGPGGSRFGFFYHFSIKNIVPNHTPVISSGNGLWITWRMC